MTFGAAYAAPNKGHSVHKYLHWIHLHVIPVPRNLGMNFKLKGVNVTGSRYEIAHLYCMSACVLLNLLNKLEKKR